MIGVRQMIDESDNNNRVTTMNKLSEDNEPVLTDEAHAHPDGRIGQLKDGDVCVRENICDEDDADQKSITLESLKDKSSQRDRDFVSESTITIVSDSELFQNSQWFSMINTSDSNATSLNHNLNSSVNALATNIGSSINCNINNVNYHNININTNTNTSISTNTTNTTNAINARKPTRRRSSLLSDITFESDEHISDDIDTHAADSIDSSWANNSDLGWGLIARGRFAPNGNNNETIEEEQHDYQEQLKQSREMSKTSSATTEAPVIPMRRVSANYQRPSRTNSRIDNPSMMDATAAPVIPMRRISAKYQGPSRANSTIDDPSMMVAAAVVAAADLFDTTTSEIPDYTDAIARRLMLRGNAAAPTLPQRTSSQRTSSQRTSSVGSQISHDTTPSFFEDGSSAAAAAAAYLSSAAVTMQPEEVLSIHTAITSDTTDTPVLMNQGDGRTFSRRKVAIDAGIAPILSNRWVSVKEPPPSFATFSSLEEDNEETRSVYEEQLNDSVSTAHPTNTKTSNQLPSIPLRKDSNSSNTYSGSLRVSDNRKPAQQSPSRLDTQPPTCPMRKNSNHHIRRTPNAASIPSHRHAKAVSQDPPLSQHRAQVQPSHKHKAPTKPMRTNSNSISRSPTSATSSS